MQKRYLVAMFLTTTTVMLGGCGYMQPKPGGECKTFPQHVMVHNHQVEGQATACVDQDGTWHTVSFKDANGNDLPNPSEILYPQPNVVMTRPQTAYSPSMPVDDMPLPPVTIYRQ